MALFGPSCQPLLSDARAKYGRRVGQLLRVWTAANQEWAVDFVHDAVESGFSTSDAISRSEVVACHVRKQVAGQLVAGGVAS